MDAKTYNLAQHVFIRTQEELEAMCPKDAAACMQKLADGLLKVANAATTSTGVPSPGVCLIPDMHNQVAHASASCSTTGVDLDTLAAVTTDMLTLSKPAPHVSGYQDAVYWLNLKLTTDNDRLEQLSQLQVTVAAERFAETVVAMDAALVRANKKIAELQLSLDSWRQHHQFAQQHVEALQREHQRLKQEAEADASDMDQLIRYIEKIGEMGNEVMRNVIVRRYKSGKRMLDADSVIDTGHGKRARPADE